METTAILAELERGRGFFPEEALAAAIAQQDGITPHLLHLLEDTIERAAELAAEESAELWTGHLHALYLLAQFRETRAYPLAIRLAHLPPEILWGLAGELASEGLQRILASVYDGDLGPIKALIEDEAADEFARSAGLDAIVELVIADRLPRSEAIAYFTHLCRGGFPRQPMYLWDCLADAILDLHPQELLADLRQAYDEQLIDPAGLPRREIAAAARRSPAETLADTFELRGGLIDDAIFELRLLGELSADDDSGDDLGDDTDDDEWRYDDDEVGAAGAEAPPGLWHDDDVPGVPYVREEPKVGRNDSCPCGSGRKYKKCCGQ